jgi:RNA polymerase sigma factor (sigma-70 family)
MVGQRPHPVLRFIRGLRGEDAATPDEDLLARFAEARDEAAFAALVRRHGPMVLGVCSRVLGDGPDAEDAFQATFVVLARRFGAVSRPGSLANWLYGVARRTALQARAKAARRRAAERRVNIMTGTDPSDAVARGELRLVLDGELSRLPERYRMPLVLCDLEGHTHEAAAHLLGCPRKTVTTRLARGRERLRVALGRRGIALSATALSAALAGTARAVSPALVEKTIHAAAAGMVPVGVATLAREVVMSMCVNKMKGLAVLLLTAGIVAAALGRPSPAGERVRGTNAGPATAEAPAQPADDAAKEDREALQGRWEGQSAEHDGRKLPEEEARKLCTSVKGDRMLLLPGGEWVPLAIKLDPSKSPKVLYMAPVEGPDKNKPVPLIYRIDKEEDTLTVCWDAKNGKAVPTDFEAKKGSGLMLIVFKHETRPPR